MNGIAQDELTEKLLRQQKRELAILYAIIQTVSRSYNLEETLESALEIILSVVGSSTGWICLLDDQQGCSAFVGQKGLCYAKDASGATPCLVQCVCGRVQKTRDVVVMRSLSKGCPLLKEQAGLEERVVGHVSVPMVTGSRLVGQLNVAFGDPRMADEMDIDLLKAIGPQLAVAVENARLWEAVQEKEKLRSELLKKVVTAQEEERRRIARELHDELGQELNSLLVRLQVLEKQTAGDAARQTIAGLKATTGEMLASIHDLALELRPPVLDDLGLVPALAQYTRTCKANLGIEVDFEVIGPAEQRFSREVETTLYRIVQEALNNVARHAKVERASVLLRVTERSAAVIIEDNGVGFDFKAVRSGQARRNRLGLYGMEERVALVGGSLTIETAPGMGTHIYAEVPLQAAGGAAAEAAAQPAAASQ